MSFDLSRAVGFELPSEEVSWNKRDLLLYALGIGARKDELAFVYELDKGFSAFPTYPVVLPLKGKDVDVNLFRERVQERAVPGLPKFDPNRVVHGSQSIQILKPLPLVSGPGWKVTKRIVGVHENKSGIIIDSEIVLVDPSGTPNANLYGGAFHVGAKATGTKFSQSVSNGQPPAPSADAQDLLKSPSRKPDWVVKDKTTEEQAVLYRLSGDYNPLHIDPRIGTAAGFGGPILHGLSTFGFAARAVLSSVGGNDPNALKLFGVRFTSPVRPGDELETVVWEVGPVKGKESEGVVEVVFVTRVAGNGKVCLGNGLAHVVKKEKNKL